MNLRKLKTDLVVKKVNPVDGIKDLVEFCDKMNHPVNNVVYQKEVTFEEVNVEANIRNYCESRDIKVTEIWGSSLYNKAGKTKPVTTLSTGLITVIRYSIPRPRLHTRHVHAVQEGRGGQEQSETSVGDPQPAALSAPRPGGWRGPEPPVSHTQC